MIQGTGGQEDTGDTGDRETQMIQGIGGQEDTGDTGDRETGGHR